MPKLKTHKGTAKTMKKRKNDYKIGRPGHNHNTGYKPTKFNRKGRSGSTLSKADQKKLKNLLK
ncbi:MAG: 50S ribosomal protein L35 [Bacilli bacterium]|nr:50S ribosomal protein L35 [Bacilli bacterium]MBQ3468614.1 50S ribosomal protein L35 [Bacilli bacterium]